MSQPLYLLPAEVAPVPNRFADLWTVLDDDADGDFSAPQQLLLEEVCRQIDEITGQDGGLLPQTDKTFLRQCWENTETIFLPNKPLTAVSAISVRRGPSTFTYDVSAGAIEIGGGGQSFTYIPWRSGQTIPSGVVAMTYGMDGYCYPFAEGDRVTVTYSCGYDPLPPTIRDVCRRMLAESLLSQMENPQGAQDIRLGRTMYRFGTQGYINAADIRTRRALLPYAVNKVR